MDDWRTIAGKPTYKVNQNGDVMNVVTGRKLKPIQQASGYVHVALCEDKLCQQKSVHRLVAEEFIPNPNGYPQVNHIDGNKANNHVSNLEWCTGSQNMKHAYATGLQRPISTQIEDSLAKAIAARRRCVRNIDTGECYTSVAECARNEGLSRSAVSMHVTGQNKRCRFEYVD